MLPRTRATPLTPAPARRYHHHPIWGLGIRACDICLKDRLLSSQTLYHEYGIDFTKHTAALMRRAYYAFVNRNEAQTLAHFSHRAIDLTNRTNAGQLYFWRPHLEGIFDLPAAEARQHLIRTVARPRLAACVRALYTRILIGHQGRPVKDISSHLFYTEGSLEWQQGSHVLHLPLLPVPAATLRAETARALLQRLFVAYQGRLVVTRTKDPLRTWSALAQHEAYRACHPAPGYTPAMTHIRNQAVNARFRAFAYTRPLPVPPA